MIGMAKGWQAVGQLMGMLELSKFEVGGDIIVNVKFYLQFAKWFDFFFYQAKICFSACSVMDHLCDEGLPYEYLESQFYANKMVE